MKLITTAFLCLVLTSLLSIQSDISELNQLIDKGKCPEAIGILEGLGSQNYVDKEVLETLGYCNYKIGDLAKAMLYYERAAKNAPRDKDIQEAIDHIRKELPVQITQIPDFVLLRWSRHVRDLMSSKNWAVLQILLALSILILLYWWWFKAAHRNWTKQRIIMILAAASLTILTGIIGYQKKISENDRHSAICKEFHNLYVAPDLRSQAVTDLGPGNKVFIIDSIGEFYKVILLDKDLGWIEKIAVEKI